MSLEVHIQKRLGEFSLNVDFQTDGGVLGILGASGCGKSYTLKCIAGVERPDSGRIVLDVSGEERAGMTVGDLLERFRAGAGKELDNDRILLSE